MASYKGDVLTAFANVAGIPSRNAVFFSTTGHDLGSPVDTRYAGISAVTAMTSHNGGLLTSFFTPIAPENAHKTGAPQPDGRIELGWLNLPPCVKVEMVKKWIPGVLLPTLHTGEQRLHVFAKIDAINVSNDDIRECALAAAGSALVASIVASPASAEGEFLKYISAMFSGESCECRG